MLDTFLKKISSRPKVKSIYKKHRESLPRFDAKALRKLCLEHDVKIAAEIGSFLGQGSSQVFIDCCDRLLCIDHFKGSGTQFHNDLLREHDMFLTFYSNIARAEDKVSILRMGSDEASGLLAKESFDLIFIDGDHSYKQVKKDIENYYPLVKPGGILCGHDMEGRLSDFDASLINQSLDQDHIPSPIEKFKEIHPGAIKAVSEYFGEKAHLFSDELMTLDDGRVGYSSIWYHVKKA